VQWSEGGREPKRGAEGGGGSGGAPLEIAKRRGETGEEQRAERGEEETRTVLRRQKEARRGDEEEIEDITAGGTGFPWPEQCRRHVDFIPEGEKK